MKGQGIDWAALQEACVRQADRRGWRLELLERTGSTNDRVFKMAPLGQDVAVCLARCQVAGRGTRGRVWAAAPERTLTFSVGRELPAAVSLDGLSLAVGAGLVEALGRIGLTGARVKWPNDLLVDGRKLAGVLVEARRVGDVRRVVVGVGINLAQGTEVAGRQPACVDELGAAASARVQARRAAWLLRRVARLLRRWPADRARLLALWQAQDALRGSPVQVTLPDSQIAGIAMGISHDGHLIVQTSTGRRILAAGEVTVRNTD